MGAAETVVSGGKTHADLAIERIVSGESYYNIFCGITDDSESLMAAAHKAGATFTSSNNNWVWLGADGFVTANPDTPELQNAFQDAVGTNVKMGSDLNDLYINYIQAWRDQFDGDDLPWKDSNVIGFSPFTAQAYDALAIAAQAATAFYNSETGLAADVITNQQLIDALKTSGLSTKGIGNVPADGLFEFDTEAGGYDGKKSYEIMNYRGDLWADVGDWRSPNTLHIVDRIQFPTGISPPSQDRNAGEGTTMASVVEKEVEKETIPVWLIIILVLLGVCLLIVGGLFCYAYSKQGKHLFENLQDEEEKVDEIELRAPKRKGYHMDEGGADT